MSRDHGHTHDGHGHHHTHDHDGVRSFDAHVSDTAVADSELSPRDISRRNLLRAAGITGAVSAGIAGMSGITPAMADDARRGREEKENEQGKDGRRIRAWLAGDHHIHTQYSPDGQYTVQDQAQHAAAYGLDWLVITDHGSAAHAKLGVENVNPDIIKARAELPGTLVFQGLEWNIPAAEHGTVFVNPGSNEVAVLKEFENSYDGVVRSAKDSTPANEALAVSGIQWLGGQVRARRVDEALFLANHPARNGIDSPHEIRAWRDADPSVAIGFEGAPGHQAAALPAGYPETSPTLATTGRGYYNNAPGANSFPAYPPESYRTWGGFDWMTSTVGGLWDSLLAEGKPWSISANSDSHTVYGDTAQRPGGSTSAGFDRDGRYGNPVYAGKQNTAAGDFWPGFYSRTHVGVVDRSYRSVMQGMRDGRMWVDHGALVRSLDVTLRASGRGRAGVETLGGTLVASKGSRLTLVVTVTAQDLPNWAQFTPRLNRVDVIRGKVDPMSASTDRDVFTAPDTKVVRQWDTSTQNGTFTLTLDLGTLEESTYVRLRGTDGNRHQPGFLGSGVDPSGPAVDMLGSADPWLDLWFYTNPIFVLATA